MNDRVVVDASLIFKWLVREEYTDKAFALARSWERSGTKRVAPYLMLAEVTNALHRRVIKDQLSLEPASELLDNLIGMNIELYESPLNSTTEPSNSPPNSSRVQPTTPTTSPSPRPSTASSGLPTNGSTVWLGPSPRTYTG